MGPLNLTQYLHGTIEFNPIFTWDHLIPNLIPT